MIPFHVTSFNRAFIEALNANFEALDSITCTTFQEVRDLANTTLLDAVLVGAKSVVGDGYGGTFAYDQSDVTTPDDDTNTLVQTSTGRRFKRVTPIAANTSVAVANLAGLKALTTRPSLVYTNGYNSAIDIGGGPPWQWVAGSVQTADDFLVAQPTSGPPGRYIRMLQAGASVHAKWAGCGLGASDDTTAFQKVVNNYLGALVDISGIIVPLKPVTVAPGTSTCPGIVGYGTGQISAAPGNVIATSLINVSKPDFFVEGVFFNMPYTGDPATRPAPDRGLVFRNDTTDMARWRVENCRFYGGASGVSMLGTCQDYRVLNCIFDNTWGEAISCEAAREVFIENNTVRNCAFDNTGLASGGIRIGVSSMVGLVERATINGNTVYRCGLGNGQEGIDFAGAVIQEIVATGNKIIECGNGGFEAKTFKQQASFTGTISGTTLTVSGVTGSGILRNQVVTGVGVAVGTKIVSGSGTTWVVDISQTVGPVAMTSALDPDIYQHWVFSNNEIIMDGTTSSIGFNLHLTGTAPTSGKAGKVLLEGNYVGNNTPASAVIGNYGAIISGWSDVSLIGNKFVDVARGADISPAGNATTTIDRLELLSNVFKGSSSGLTTSGSGTINDLRVQDCDIVGGTRAISFSTPLINRLLIEGVYAEATTAAGASAAIELRNIQGGKVLNSTLKSPGNNVVVLQGTACDDVTFRKNDITITTGTPFSISVGTNIKVEENTFTLPDGSTCITGVGGWTQFGNKRPSRNTDPNGSVAGTVGEMIPNYGPTSGGIWAWICTTAGSTTTAVWVPISIYSQNDVPGGRLTLTTLVPIQTALATVTTVFYTPFKSARIPIAYVPGFYTNSTFTQLSNVLTNSATGNAGPAAVTTNSNYDLFVWNNAGTLTLTRGPLWTSDTTRGTGAGTTELELKNGILTNKVAITNGPGANLGTYVGTIRTNGSSQAVWDPGGSAVGGNDAILGVWNAYNRVRVNGLVIDTTVNWSNSSATWAATNASNNNRVSYVHGLQEDYFDVRVSILAVTGTGKAQVGIGQDSTSAPSGRYGTSGINNSWQIDGEQSDRSLGFHFAQSLARAVDAISVDLYTDGTGLLYDGWF